MYWRSGLIGLTFALVSFCAAAQELYRLEANDRIEIWTTVEPSLQRTVLVGPDGWLALPLVGHVKAAGMTMPDLEQMLQEKLKGYFKGPIDLTVMLQPTEELTQTVYVAGQVSTPGAYPFKPGMTLMHAISMAGGLQSGPATASTDQQISETRAVIVRDTARLAALEAQIARTSAELSGQEMPADKDLLPSSAESERRILSAHRTEEVLLLKARDEALALNKRTTETLRQRAEAHQSRIKLAEKRLAAVSKLVSKGYTNEAQQLELQSELTEMHAQALEFQASLDAAAGEADAEIARTESALQERRTLLEVEQRDAQRERNDVEARLADNKWTLNALVGSSPPDRNPARSVVFSIIRTVDGRPTELEATPLSSVEPGDLVQAGSAGPAARRGVSTVGAVEAGSGDAFVQ